MQIDPKKYTRNYRFRGGNTGSEQKRFWIFLVIGLLIGMAIVYLF
ncbi:hypothetical protein BDE36_4363 [Arcticibacter tournemirensis]|nr:hypothetical protein BDE36_4363 [Arcticibacter tournemirensis]